MPGIVFEHDYKDGQMQQGSVLLDTKKIRILGRQVKQIVEVINRADRTDGLIGGGIEMLIIEHEGHQYGSINATVETFQACLCFPRMCEMGICLDGCSMVLDDCCITLR